MSKIPVLERTADVEINQLKARVCELEAFLQEAAEEPERDCGCSPCMGRCWSYESDLEYIRDRAEEVLSSKPAQSLEAHDREVAAKALEDGVNELRKRADLRNYDYQTNSIRSMLDAELMKIAARIRAG